MSESDIQALMSTLLMESDDERWRDFESRAESQPELWRDFAELQREHMLLQDAMEQRIACAADVELPCASSPAAHSPSGRQIVACLGAWTGWAAAAALALALIVPRVYTTEQPIGDDGGAVAASNDEVLGELPVRWLLDARPIEGRSGYEVHYVRPVLERRIVDDLYQFAGQDEWQHGLSLARYHPEQNRTVWE